MPEIIGTDLYEGWYKLLVPDIINVLGDLFLKPELLISILYTKLGTEPAAFDTQLTLPMLCLDKPVLVLLADKKIVLPIQPDDIDVKTTTEPTQLPQLLPLHYINRFNNISEHESRCYISAGCVTAIIPVNSKCPLAKTLYDLTTESNIVVAQPGQISKILNLRDS